jgi:hypothetical protein
MSTDSGTARTTRGRETTAGSVSSDRTVIGWGSYEGQKYLGQPGLVAVEARLRLHFAASRISSLGWLGQWFAVCGADWPALE